MGNRLLPDDFDRYTEAAVLQFWQNRQIPTSSNRQGGARDKVVGGKNMDGFINLVEKVATHCGLDPNSVKSRKSSVVLPGFFRATKSWDVLVIHRQRLLAVFEFKSQVGSFGNNFNNRSEEVIGAAADLWVAHHHGAYGHHGPSTSPRVADAPAVLNPVVQTDPRPPFLAWMMLLEECPASLTPVTCEEPNYPVFPEFRAASYAQRYQILCERLVERRLYSAAALELSPADAGLSEGRHRSLSPATSIRNLFAEFAGKAAAAADDSY